MGTEYIKEKRAAMAVMDEDILFEVLKHLDSKSLAMAACVSRRWKRTAEEEALWEGICTRHWHSMGPQITSVVRALGGFRRLYIHCLRPLLKTNIKCAPSSSSSSSSSSFTKDHFNLSLSLFSIDCYERLGRRSGAPNSLKFLCSNKYHFPPSCSASFPLHKTALPPPPPPPPSSPPHSAARAL